jgi:trimethylamine--corrinoid protein Co-methyltransferase
LKPIKSQSIDFQIGYEKGISAALAAVSGASVVNVHGGMHVELTYHPVQAVLDDDILGMRGRFMEGVRVTDEMLAVDVIEEVARSRASSWLMPTPGNGGKKNSICPRSPPDHPILNGSSRAKERGADILARHETTPPLPPGKEEELDRMLEEARAYYKRKDLI